MERQKDLIRLLIELKPLRFTLAGDPDYRKLRYTFEDVLGFLDEKIIHVFMKYPDHEYGEIKGLAITSMYRVKPRLFRDYHPVVDAVKEDSVIQEELDLNLTPRPTLEDLAKNLSQVFSSVNKDLLKIILDPPQYVTAKVSSEDVRLPSRLFLEYLDMPTDSQSVKRLNRFRRGLEDFIREFVDPKTLKIKGNHPKNILSITF